MENQNSKKRGTQIAPELLNKMDAYWRVANYLSVGQIYLRDNPLMRQPLKPEHIKPTLLRHWGCPRSKFYLCTSKPHHNDEVAYLKQPIVLYTL